MGKKLDKLRRIVQKLGTKYGKYDEHVLRLQIELEALEAVEKAKADSGRLSADHGAFQSLTRRNYHASKVDQQI